MREGLRPIAGIRATDRDSTLAGEREEVGSDMLDRTYEI